jgi:hypothetical protein
MKGLKIFFCLSFFFLMMVPSSGFSVEKVKIANIDNFILQKYLTKDGMYDRELEDVLGRVSEKSGFFGTSWNKSDKQAEKDCIAEKTVREPDLQYFGLKKIKANAKIKEVVYPAKKSGWTDVILDTAGSEGIILEIEGGDLNPIHHQLKNIGYKRADGKIENLDVVEKGALNKKKEPVLLISKDYFDSLKEKGGAQKLFDEDIEWKEGFKILVIRKMFPEVPGENDKFLVLSISYEFDNDNDTVLIMVSPERMKLAGAEPTLFFGWRSKEVSCTSASGD